MASFIQKSQQIWNQAFSFLKWSPFRLTSDPAPWVLLSPHTTSSQPRKRWETDIYGSPLTYNQLHVGTGSGSFSRSLALCRWPATTQSRIADHEHGEACTDWEAPDHHSCLILFRRWHVIWIRWITLGLRGLLRQITGIACVPRYPQPNNQLPCKSVYAPWKCTINHQAEDMILRHAFRATFTPTPCPLSSFSHYLFMSLREREGGGWLTKSL